MQQPVCSNLDYPILTKILSALLTNFTVTPIFLLSVTSADMYSRPTDSIRTKLHPRTGEKVLELTIFDFVQ